VQFSSTYCMTFGLSAPAMLYVTRPLASTRRASPLQAPGSFPTVGAGRFFASSCRGPFGPTESCVAYGWSRLCCGRRSNMRALLFEPTNLQAASSHGTRPVSLGDL
jgi:hypothetical protein